MKHLRQNSIYILFLLMVFGSLLCEHVGASVIKRKGHHHSSEENSSEENSGSREDKWDWKDKDNKNNFQCPKSYGAFPDAEDCTQYYICRNGKSSRQRCDSRKLFDIFRLKCLPKAIAICNDEETSRGTTISNRRSTTPREGRRTTRGRTTSNRRSTTPSDTFTCPEYSGDFPHPEDCSKFYNCKKYKPKLKTCSKGKLFDGVRKECREAKKVHCGSRGKSTTPQPSTTTIQETTTSTPQPITTTVEATTNITTAPTVEPPATTTTVVPTTAEELTPEEPTTEELTTEEEPTGPPETTCDEDDLDCIIKETGEMPKWFKCPAELGTFPHPSSKKLFILCIRKKPMVKKCGQDQVYSEDVKTCISPSDVALLLKSNI